MMIFIYSQTHGFGLGPQSSERLRGCFVAFNSCNAPFTNKKIGVSSLDWLEEGLGIWGKTNFYLFIYFSFV